ncbi:MAG TPA: AMP-binding protein, partial [Planctomycetota bacterium]|nr:AMP-binding protein [Planctomycetota bacterium]
YVDIYGPYVTLNCRFEISHALELLEALTPEDRERFDFDPRLIRWKNYIQDVHIPGLKRNILRMEAPPRAGAGEGHLLDEEAAATKRRAGTGAIVRGVPQTIVDLCARGAEKFGRKSLVEIRRTSTEPGAPPSVRISYAELFDRAGELARGLIARLDLHPGDRVALMAENCPEWALAYMALSRACCTVVPFDRQMAAADVARLMKLVDAKALIISPACLKAGEGELRPGSGLPPALNLFNELQPFAGFAWPYPEASIGDRPLRNASPETLASILFTSGTTRDPKGVMLSHSNLISDALSVAEVLEPMESDRFLSVLPLHHALEFTGGFLIPMYGGSTIHHLEFLRPKDVSDTMKLAEITVVIGVPRLFKLFMDNIKSRLASAGTATRLKVSVGKTVADAWEMAGGANPRKKIFKQVHDGFGGQVRLFVSGGAALDPEIFHFFKNFGITIVEGYGLTETAPVVAVNPLSAPKAGSVGPAVPGAEIRIGTPNGEGIGEVLVRGPMVMQGYWQNPSTTEKAFESGWYRTGDLGKIDKDGYLHLTGRLKDVIVTAAGKNVYPDEIEALLRDIPGVKDLCVLGLPARSGRGEEVAVVIVLQDEKERSNVQAAIDRISQSLPTHQRVSRVIFSKEDLPKTSTLKVQRGKLRNRCLKDDGGEALPGMQTPAAATKSESVAPASDVFVEVARAAAEHAEPKGRVSATEITPELKLQMDLGIDSIGRVSMLQSLELQFEISIPQEDEQKLFTVRDVMTVVENAIKARGEGGAKSREQRLWQRSQSSRSEVQEGMRQTLSKSVLQGVFSTSASVFLNTYLGVECHGLENIPAQGPYILAANHCSHLDSVAIREVLGKRASSLHVMGAKDYFFDTRVKSWFFTTFLNALPFDREENVAESLATCKTVLENGRAILLFPEGTRSISGQLQPFKPGIGVLGIELSVPIIPVYLRGTFESLPKGRALPRPSRIEVRIGAPVDFSTLKAESGRSTPTDLYRRAANELRARIESLSNLPDKS